MALARPPQHIRREGLNHPASVAVPRGTDAPPFLENPVNDYKRIMFLLDALAKTTERAEAAETRASMVTGWWNDEQSKRAAAEKQLEVFRTMLPPEASR